MATNTMMRSIILTTVCLFFGFNAPVIGQISLYQDIKAHQEGDIITIVLRENISGSSTSDSKTASNSDGSMAGSASGNFLPFEPTFGSDVRVDYGSDERNLASQKQLLEGYMSVQIIEVTPSGDLVVEGSRVTDINSEKHEMTLKGIVRPIDIDNRNRVLSYRVANAEISYHQEGGRFSGVTKKRGFLRRTLFAGLGVALSAVIIVRELK